MADTLSWIQRNEPQTLQFGVYRVSESNNGTEVSMFERLVGLRPAVASFALTGPQIRKREGQGGA